MLVRQRRLQLSRSVLPIITSDDNGEHTQKERAHKKRISVSLIIIIYRTFLFGLIVITSVFVIKAGLSSHYNHQIEHDTIARQSLSKLPLSKFSELEYALATSDLVALYFAASWCPMSTPISIALDLAFGNGDILLTNDGIRKELSIVYVSSDKTLDTFNGYIHNRKWLAVPYESKERNDLKRHFSTCAKIELEELDIDRKHEIPTIIVIDSKTHGIITTNGADDVGHMGDEALQHWKDVQDWIRNLQSDTT
jgi:hypothetical protein